VPASDSNSSPATAPSPTPTPRAPSGLGGLKRMSSTAGASSGTYRPVNPIAVIAIVSAVIGLGIFVHDGFVVAVALGALAGLAAVLQVARSRGTQTGLAIASLAVLGSAALATSWGLAEAREADRRATIAAAAGERVEAFGAALAARDWPAAYAMTADGFQDEVPFASFEAVVSSYPEAARRDGTTVFGEFVRAELGEAIRVSPGPGGRPEVDAELRLFLERGDPISQAATLREAPDGWKVRHFHKWFPGK